MLARLRTEALLQPLGVEVLSISFVSAKPTPEVAKALEAEYRETLLRKADEAIYARRAAAVQNERQIKENEISNESRPGTAAAAVDRAAKRQRASRGGRAGPCGRCGGGGPRPRVRVGTGRLPGSDPRLLLALALRDLGQNAGKVGSLTITSEMLASSAERPGAAGVGADGGL